MPTTPGAATGAAATAAADGRSGEASPMLRRPRRATNAQPSMVIRPMMPPPNNDHRYSPVAAKVSVTTPRAPAGIS